jgi:GH24 family phage-related lysozyme (muramidase)
MSFADSMTASENCIKFIKQREGFSKYPYWDNSQWTVGYGTRCPDDKLDEYKKVGITEEAALELLASMMADFEKELHRYIDRHKLTLTQQQFDALVSFTFNCGAGWTDDTNGYMNTAIREGQTGSKLLYALCLWSRAGGDFILVKRRLAEANIYLNGVYGTNSEIPDSYRCVYLDGNGGTIYYIPHGFDANDPAPITYSFKKKPTGVDKNGKTFTYEFLGWHTEDGTKVEVLDKNIKNGAILYAKWADPSGKVVSLPKGTTLESLVITVAEDTKVRSGPGTYYPLLTTANKGIALTITETYSFGGILWGKSELGWLSLSNTDYKDALANRETWPKDGIVTADYVNVRKGAGTNHERVYQLNKGDRVTICEKTTAGGLIWGRLQDNNWICLTYVSFDIPSEEEPKPTEPQPTEPEETVPETTEPTVPETTEPEKVVIPGDVNGDETVTKDDAIYLLRHVLFPEKYVLTADGDIDKNGSVTKDDAIYLLRHVLFPEKYPLTK